MLSVDLERGVTSDQRNTFNAELERREWAKMPAITTTWRASFVDGVSEGAAIRTTESDVAAAAKEAAVSTYHAAVHVGANRPTEFRR